ncbi:hypothetical protein C8R44DRAFT_821361 [Mycena epipterygia]|nr:hypothetical protein C8R44DRAFT_821361 [Mycena epipterygia]
MTPVMRILFSPFLIDEASRSMLQNLDPVCGILTRISPHVLEIHLISGEQTGKKAFIPWISITPSAEQLAFEMKRRQYPVRLAFLMTINKA